MDGVAFHDPMHEATKKAAYNGGGLSLLAV